MPEPKHFMMIPNAEHSLATGIYDDDDDDDDDDNDAEPNRYL